MNVIRSQKKSAINFALANDRKRTFQLKCVCVRKSIQKLLTEFGKVGILCLFCWKEWPTYVCFIVAGHEVWDRVKNDTLFRLHFYQAFFLSFNVNLVLFQFLSSFYYFQQIASRFIKEMLENAGKYLARVFIVGEFRRFNLNIKLLMRWYFVTFLRTAQNSFQQNNNALSF